MYILTRGPLSGVFTVQSFNTADAPVRFLWAPLLATGDDLGSSFLSINCDTLTNILCERDFNEYMLVFKVNETLLRYWGYNEQKAFDRDSRNQSLVNIFRNIIVWNVSGSTYNKIVNIFSFFFFLLIKHLINISRIIEYNLFCYEGLTGVCIFLGNTLKRS